MTKKNEDNDVKVGNYIVAFIDLLGQQEQLRNLRALPDKDKPEEFDDIIKILKNTYGVVSGMRELFTDSFESFARKPKDSSIFTPEQKEVYALLNNNPIKIQSFSDSVVLSMSLSTESVKLPARGIWGILGATATTFLCLLAAGHPIRGGIDVGIGMNLTKNEIYGPSLSRAYTLESKIANYPRIVIGKELIQYLELSKKQEPCDTAAQVAIKMASECLDFLALDDDGYPIIDYLGKSFKKHLGEVVDSSIVKKAYDNVLFFSNKYQQEKNSKVAFKYTLLRNYFEDRLELWI